MNKLKVLLVDDSDIDYINLKRNLKENGLFINSIIHNRWCQI